MNKEEKEAIEYLKKYIEWETCGERSLETDILTVLNLIQKQKNEINKLKETLNDRVDVKQTADSISFTLPSKVAAESMKVLDESALAIENKRLCELLEKQEKIIDKMAEKLVEDTEWFYSEFDNYTKQDFIEYFKKEVEKDVKD